jgi:WhiB family redox-sensing transcriptional regulator
MSSDVTDWRNRASCLGESPDLFFPIGFTEAALLQLERAKVVCRGCSVREECLRWAMDVGIDQGVWGGLSEQERRSQKRRLSRQQARVR